MVLECGFEGCALSHVDQHVSSIDDGPAPPIVVQQVLDCELEHRVVEMLTSFR
jgi:hypothetical protein